MPDERVAELRNKYLIEILLHLDILNFSHDRDVPGLHLLEARRERLRRRVQRRRRLPRKTCGKVCQGEVIVA